MQHPRAEPVKVETTVRVERDEFPVELNAGRKFLCELGQAVAHIPAAPASHPQAVVCADECADVVQLRLECPAAAGGDRTGAGEHRFRQPQHRLRAYSEPHEPNRCNVRAGGFAICWRSGN